MKIKFIQQNISIQDQKSPYRGDLEGLYIPPIFLPNSHLQTIFPSIFRKVKGINYQRERISTPDNDFLDLDWSFALKTNFTENRTTFEDSKNMKITTEQVPPLEVRGSTLVIITHGLEGSTDRQYVKGMVKIFNENGYDCLAWNFRSCSEEINKNLIFYHSGATYDLDYVVKHAIKKGYSNINLVGFSLGGNLTLKYLGEKNSLFEIKKAAVFSVPMDLASSSKKIARKENWIYTARFLKSLKRKIIQKAYIFTDDIKLANLGKIKTVEAFDDEYTSKLHGFINAKDYYAKNSSIIFVEKITIPTLIVNAKNDPFLSEECYPSKLLANHSHVILEIPEKGGHCGFMQKGYRNFLWSELRALNFIKNI